MGFAATRSAKAQPIGFDSPSFLAVRSSIAAVAPEHVAVLRAADAPLETIPGQIG